MRRMSLFAVAIVLVLPACKAKEKKQSDQQSDQQTVMESEPDMRARPAMDAMEVDRRVHSAKMVPDKPKNPNVGKKTGSGDAAKDSTLRMLDLSAALARWGRDHKHAGAIALAGRVIQDVKPQELKAAIDKTEGGKGKGAENKDTGLPKDTVGLVALAKKMAGQDKQQIAVVDGLLAMGAKTRGSDKAGCVIHRVEAGETVTYKPITFEGGEIAWISVRGDGDTDLDFYLYDENGGEIDSDTDSTDVYRFTWVPRWTGPFLFKIQNRGDVFNQYVFCSN